MINYAALLALMVALTFSFPFLVRLAEKVNIPRSYSMVATLVITLVVLLYRFIRKRVIWQQYFEEQVSFIESQLAQRPQDYEAFFDVREQSFDSLGSHLADIYLNLGKKEYALKVLKRYMALEKRDLGYDEHALRLLGRLEQEALTKDYP